jgi:hypothetical protein
MKILSIKTGKSLGAITAAALMFSVPMVDAFAGDAECNQCKINADAHAKSAASYYEYAASTCNPPGANPTTAANCVSQYTALALQTFTAAFDAAMNLCYSSNGAC